MTQTTQERIRALRLRRDKMQRILDSGLSSQQVDGTALAWRSRAELQAEVNSLTREINDLVGRYPVTRFS